MITNSVPMMTSTASESALRASFRSSIALSHRSICRSAARCASIKSKASCSSWSRSKEGRSGSFSNYRILNMDSLRFRLPSSRSSRDLIRSRMRSSSFTGTRSSRNQLLVRHMVRVHDPAQRIHEDVRVTSVVEPPLQFFKVAVDMLDADLVERADDGALETLQTLSMPLVCTSPTTHCSAL